MTYAPQPEIQQSQPVGMVHNSGASIYDLW